MNSGLLRNNNYYTNWQGATIVIEIDANTHIICTAPTGTQPSDKGWIISKDTILSDSVFGGYPYTWTKWAVNPDTGQPTEEPIFKATDVVTVPLTFK